MTEKEKKYKLNPPVGSLVLPKEWMNEQEVREFMPQLVQESDQSEVWKEKAIKDPIENVIEWLNRAGYQVEIK